MPRGDDIRFRRGTTAMWAADPVLEDGEPGYDKSTNTLKVGDGNTKWSLLPGITGGSGGGGVAVDNRPVIPIYVSSYALNWRGGWAPNTIYAVGDLVYYNGSTFTSIAGNDYTDTFSGTTFEAGWTNPHNSGIVVDTGSALFSFLGGGSGLDGYAHLLRSAASDTRHTVTATLMPLGSNASAVVWGYNSPSDHFYARYTGTSVELRRFLDGSRITLGSFTTSGTPTVKVVHDFITGEIAVYLNNATTPVTTVTGQNLTRTNSKVGIGFFGFGDRVDNFVTPLPPRTEFVPADWALVALGTP